MIALIEAQLSCWLHWLSKLGELKCSQAFQLTFKVCWCFFFHVHFLPSDPKQSMMMLGKGRAFGLHHNIEATFFQPPSHYWCWGCPREGFLSDLATSTAVSAFLALMMWITWHIAVHAYTVNIFFLPTGFRAVIFDTWHALYSTENYHDNVHNNCKSRIP